MNDYYSFAYIREWCNKPITIKKSERGYGKKYLRRVIMGKGNCVYKVVIYVGDFYSHDKRVIYTSSKMSKAEEYLHDYCRSHPELSKAYIERSYGREEMRNAKRHYDDEE